MIIEIKPEESIKENRMIYKISRFEKIYDWLIWTAFIVSLPLATIMYSYSLISDKQLNDNLIEVMIINAISFGLGYLIYYRHKTALKLERLTGISPDKNRQIINKVLEELKWTKMYENKDFLITFPEVSFLSSMHQITILYDDKDILINSITFGRGAMISPFHRSGDNERKDKIIRRFKSLTLVNND